MIGAGLTLPAWARRDTGQVITGPGAIVKYAEVGTGGFSMVDPRPILDLRSSVSW